MALKKLCRCGKLIDYNQKDCDECSKKVDAQNKKRHKDYRLRRTDVDEQKFYNSKPWKVTRQVVISRDNGLCLLCLYRKLIRSYYTVHHIEELKENWDKRLDFENLICLCESCHQYVHDVYNKSEESKREMQELLRRLIEMNSSNSKG
ncbi:HNH endonuclease signature motif containing protein [Proteiniborus sp. MB09-C3]|uniref:HNH endonuclease n=1 Tax=Proteiniborus sp. MB09-C3 TaxID=3050072 RepID=UPI002554604F|nr:HNH endonuclease signature motif containing protein [Proteiniborus sp. MB09-C3]WIV10534.1 HNH endonuclease signature motif containing protein [Proteiniborus sp. MB09-C3]